MGRPSTVAGKTKDIEKKRSVLGDDSNTAGTVIRGRVVLA